MGSIPAATTVWLVEPSQTTNGIKVLAAAYVALNLEVDGSNPSPATFSGRGKVWPVFMETRRVVRNHEIVGSNPTVLTQHFHKHSGVAKW